MRNFSLFYCAFALILLSLSSCEDNYVLEDEQVITSDPTEVASTIVSGIVVDLNDSVVPDAEIVYSHNNELKSVFSDEDGNYLIELPKDDSRVLMQAHAQDYLTSGVNALSLDLATKEKNIKLLQEGELSYTGNTDLLSLNTNATLSGQVLLANGDPAENVIIVLLDLSSFFFVSYTLTDENGNYLLASEPFENYGLFAYNSCNSVESIAEYVTLETDDLDFGVFQSGFNKINQFTLTGQVTNCFTNEALGSGSIRVSLEGSNKVYEGDIVNGFYNVIVDNCQASTCYNIRIISSQFVHDVLEVECEEITGSQIGKDYTVCGAAVTFQGEIRLLVGTDSLIYINATAGIDSTTGFWSLVGFTPNLESSFLTLTKADGEGLFDTEVMVISESGVNIFSNYDGSGFPFRVDIQEINDYIRGTVSGQAITVQGGGILPISGTFDIKL